MEDDMTKKQERQYSEPESIKDILNGVLSDKKLLLGCGHHVSFDPNLGNDIAISNSKEPKIICSLCGH
jgi:hypothetical protein